MQLGRKLAAGLVTDDAQPPADAEPRRPLRAGAEPGPPPGRACADTPVGPVVRAPEPEPAPLA